ncbi:hypothetical protein GH5_02186 [Leishmania sp. Ghana 2012 LV757]|uniref:hypothetical protein n=1 Tax=Leishmania sp. Ghana 2012 LV757 TaxID=2803181 RepID=UPI001B592B49|nr:hypothetical protein GH5_02186 [Leishmania sp. Ghana 2012 LV757]
MSSGDKSARAPGGGTRRLGISGGSRSEIMSPECEAGVEVHVLAPLRAQRKPMMTSSARGDSPTTATVDMFVADADSLAFPSTTSAMLFASFRARWAHAVQVFQFALTEPGMALIAALILFAMSFLGCITAFFIAPSLTTSLATHIQRSLDNVVSEGGISTLPKSWMPDVVSTVQCGLRALLVPSLLVGAAGVWVLSDPERRRPGKWLMGYSVLVLALGFMLLYLLLRVLLSGQLGLWQSTLLDLFENVLENLDDEAGQCIWEYAHPCSGFSSCCVTNLSALNMSEEELLKDDEVWRSLCFVTMQSGQAVRRRRSHGDSDVLEDITKAVQGQCGQIAAYIDLNEDYPLYSTACALANRSVEITPAHSMSCEDYFIGHFSSTIGFDMCLLFGMTVCSLVSGVVAFISNHQRPRMTEFLPVNMPSSSAKESAMVAKGDGLDDCRGVSRKRS